MIPRERDDRMLVTITVGELYALVAKAAEEAADRAVDAVFRRLEDVEKDGQDDDLLVGGENIAKTIGVDRSTLYRLRREGCLGDAVGQLGNGKLVARRSELLNAITEGRK